MKQRNKVIELTRWLQFCKTEGHWLEDRLRTWRYIWVLWELVVEYSVHREMISESVCWIYLCVHSPSCIRHFETTWTIWTLARQASLSMEFSRQEYWRRLPLPTPGNRPDSGIKAPSLASPALAGGSFTTAPSGKLNMCDSPHPNFFLFLFLKSHQLNPCLPNWILECSLEKPNGCWKSLLYVAIWSTKSKSLVYQLITPPWNLLVYKNKNRKAYGKKSPTQKWNLYILIYELWSIIIDEYLTIKKMIG